MRSRCPPDRSHRLNPADLTPSCRWCEGVFFLPAGPSAVKAMRTGLVVGPAFAEESMMSVFLEKQGDGRFDVLVEGHRVGLVMGGGRKWTAEASDGQVLGAFATKKAAVGAVAQDAADPVWVAMERMSNQIGLPRHYRTDLKVDRKIVREWGGQTDFLWLLRENGTNLIALDTDWTRREASAVLTAFEAEGSREANPARIVHVNPRAGSAQVVKAISWEQARALIQRPSRYFLDHHSRTLQERRGGEVKVLAQIDVVDASGIYCAQHAVDMTVRLVDAETRQIQPLYAAAFAYLVHYFGSLFAVPRSVKVLSSKGSLLDSWQSKHAVA